MVAWVLIQEVLQNCLNFHKVNRCHQLLVPIVAIGLFPDAKLHNLS